MSDKTEIGRRNTGEGGVRPRGGRARYWTRERLAEEAAKWPTRSQWSKGHPSSFTAAKEQKLLDELKPALSGDALAAFQAERLRGGAPEAREAPRAGGSASAAASRKAAAGLRQGSAETSTIDYRGVSIQRTARRPGAEPAWEATRGGQFVAAAADLEWTKRAVDLWIAARPGERSPRA